MRPDWTYKNMQTLPHIQMPKVETLELIRLEGSKMSRGFQTAIQGCSLRRPSHHGYCGNNKSALSFADLPSSVGGEKEVKVDAHHPVFSNSKQIRKHKQVSLHGWGCWNIFSLQYQWLWFWTSIELDWSNQSSEKAIPTGLYQPDELDSPYVI